VIRLATLDCKLLRDLLRLRAQAFAVSAVLACGVALFVMATGMYGSLERAFAEQERDFATLRVLGFHGREVAYVLMAEMGSLLLVALPAGVILGNFLSRWLISQFRTKRSRG